jgi:hypothetical protein
LKIDELLRIGLREVSLLGDRLELGEQFGIDLDTFGEREVFVRFRGALVLAVLLALVRTVALLLPLVQRLAALRALLGVGVGLLLTIGQQGRLVGLPPRRRSGGRSALLVIDLQPAQWRDDLLRFLVDRRRLVVTIRHPWVDGYRQPDAAPLRRCDRYVGNILQTR